MDKLGGPMLGPLLTPLHWGTDIVSMILGVLGHPVNRVINWFTGKAANIFCGAKSAAKKMVICGILFVVILWVSMFLYASFYHIYVPTANIVRPAHFKFRVCPSGVGMCTFPMANVTLGAENKAEILGRGQQYLIILQMQVPDSFTNRDVGMFMVMVRMYDRYGVITQESSRAVSLKYQSNLLKTMQTVLLAPLYITGFAEEVQTLTVDLFGNFWDDYYRPSVGALLEIHSRQLVFYSAYIQFHAAYGGLRYYLFYYPITCAVLGIAFNCLWVTMALLIPWYTLGLNMFSGLNGAGGGGGGTPAHSSSITASSSGAMEPWTDLGGGGGGGSDVRSIGGAEVEVMASSERLDSGSSGEVETAPRYFVQPFTMGCMPSAPSHPVSSTNPQTSVSTSKPGDHKLLETSTPATGESSGKEGSLLRHRTKLESPSS